MDRPGNTAAELEGALGDIRSVNRYLRGSSILVEAVLPLLLAQRPGETLSVLDVGTGGADLPRALVAAARRRGRAIRVVAVDRDRVTLDYARRESAGFTEIETREADAFDLPFPPTSFDVVTASMFLHHFTHDDAVHILTGFRSIAKRVVLINDLRRHVVPWAFIGLAARATRRHPMFVHDAPLSVLRGFTDEELRAVARDAGAAQATVARRLPYRLLLTMPARGAGA